MLLDPDKIEYILRTHAVELVTEGSNIDQIAVDGKALAVES